MIKSNLNISKFDDWMFSSIFICRYIITKFKRSHVNVELLTEIDIQKEKINISYFINKRLNLQNHRTDET